MVTWWIALGLCLLLVPTVLGAGPEPQTTIAAPVTDAQRGVQRYSIESPFLSGKNVIEVLLPDKLEPGRKYRVLYVLPVDVGIGGQWGDALMAVKKANTHNQHNLICVCPAFDTIPWFGAHADNPRIRHEDYLTKVVVPLVDRDFATMAKPDGRLLLGFSKSGCGAFTLLLRNPQTFGYAASWDAPLMMRPSDLGKYGSKIHFGTPEQFAKYLPTELCKAQAAALQAKTRLVLTGSDGFDKDTRGMHEWLTQLKVAHMYHPDWSYKHHWETGWVGPLADALMALVEPPAAPKSLPN